MAQNVDRPNGFLPVYHLTTGMYNGQTRRYFSTGGLAIGDVVALSGTACTAAQAAALGADAIGGIPSVSKVSANDGAAVGVVVSVEPTRDNEENKYLPSGTNGFVMVSDDPFVLYEAQEDGVSSQLAVTDVGALVDVIDAGLDTTRGSSGMELDSSTAGSGADAQILGLSQRPNNQLGDSTYPNARWVVRLMGHQYLSTSGV